jgi:Spy/CpxP family protein refolding chaperone
MKIKVAMSNTPNMTKLIALVTAGLFVAGTMFAGEHGNCTKQVGNQAKAACQVSLASLNLTPDQKTKMDAAMAEHQKAGCSEASEAKYMESAKSVLTKEQYAKFKAQCAKGEKGKTQT